MSLFRNHTEVGLLSNILCTFNLWKVFFVLFVLFVLFLVVVVFVHCRPTFLLMPFFLPVSYHIDRITIFSPPTFYATFPKKTAVEIIFNKI